MFQWCLIKYSYLYIYQFDMRTYFLIIVLFFTILDLIFI